MMKCRRRQAANSQKSKHCQRSFPRFLLVEAEPVEAKTKAVGVEAEALLKTTVSHPWFLLLVRRHA